MHEGVGDKSLGDSFFDSFTVTKDARNIVRMCVSQRYSASEWQLLHACLQGLHYITLQAPNAMENAPQPAPAKPLHDPFGVRDIGLRKLLEIPVMNKNTSMLKKTENCSEN